MTNQTKSILEAIDSAHSLSRGIALLQKELSVKAREIQHGEAIPEDFTAKFQLISKSAVALNRLAQMLRAISDNTIRTILVARTVLGMPWELMCTSDGSDALAACTAYLDTHANEIDAIFGSEVKEG